METLGIHPRIMRFFLAVFGANLIISVVTQFNNAEMQGFDWFINLIFPVVFAVVGGSILGLFIFLVPQKGYGMMPRLLRSKLIGVMVVTFLWFVYHVYHLLHKILLA